jgi:hypothetical protein
MLAGMTLVLTGPSLGLAEERASAAFEDASVHFEQNATDGDVEVVFKLKSGDEGLAKLTIVSPDGRKVVDFSAPDATTLGIRQFDFESPEPPDVARLKAAYPEGEYTFSGATAGGDSFEGSSTLRHALPATATFVHPAPDAEGVPAEGLEIRWGRVPGVSAYVLEIEQDDLGVGLEARLPASATAFSMPAGFLVPGTEYDLAIGTVTEEGNVSFVETSFTIAE